MTLVVRTTFDRLNAERHQRGSPRWVLRCTKRFVLGDSVHECWCLLTPSPVAQWNRALDYESRCRRFESVQGCSSTSGVMVAAPG